MKIEKISISNSATPKSRVNSTCDLEKFLTDEAFIRSFIKIIVSIEIINLCYGKKPSDEFIKVFKGCVPGMNKKKFLMHLATLIYLDKRNKLFRAIVAHPDFSSLSSEKIIMLAKRTLRKEGYAIRSRLDSDSVKIKGAVKTAKIIQNERTIRSKDGSEYTVEEAFEPAEKFYKRIFQGELIENLWQQVNEYLERTYRKDRAKHMVMYVDYILTNKEENFSSAKVARNLKLSRKTVYQIKKTLQGDHAFRSLLGILLEKTE